MKSFQIISTLAVLVGMSVAAFAQGTEVSLATPETSSDEEVEVTSDTLNVNRETGEAVFVGSVVVTQGELRLLADEVVVLYEEATDTRPGRVAEVNAEGNVFFTSGLDTAESQSATYMPVTRELRMSGDVFLKQGQFVVAGDALVLNLETGRGQMEGRVRTVLQPEAQ
ncbi:MAG: LptA/OstA family protein [Dinoroseobacter sp.]|nr:LptA/OstA family protein [Dinoroseobacter sp.]MDJ0995077.1 LptA/OstA family protein [Dinoroseobacter sp.]